MGAHPDRTQSLCSLGHLGEFSGLLPALGWASEAHSTGLSGPVALPLGHASLSALPEPGALLLGQHQGDVSHAPSIGGSPQRAGAH